MAHLRGQICHSPFSADKKCSIILKLETGQLQFVAKMHQRALNRTVKFQKELGLYSGLCVLKALSRDPRRGK